MRHAAWENLGTHGGHNVFAQPDVVAKIAANPQTAAHLGEDSLMEDRQETVRAAAAPVSSPV